MAIFKFLPFLLNSSPLVLIAQMDYLKPLFDISDIFSNFGFPGKQVLFSIAVSDNNRTFVGNLVQQFLECSQCLAILPQQIDVNPLSSELCCLLLVKLGYLVIKFAVTIDGF